jgi:hypothetical protein
VDHMDKEIEEIKRLMLEAAQEAVIREVWDRRKPAGMMQEHRQQSPRGGTTQRHSAPF